MRHEETRRLGVLAADRQPRDDDPRRAGVHRRASRRTVSKIVFWFAPSEDMVPLTGTAGDLGTNLLQHVHAVA
jgi:hypothetical protein